MQKDSPIYDSEIESLLGEIPDRSPLDLIGETELADLLGITGRAVRDLAADSVIQRHGKGVYHRRDAVRAYCERVREQARKRGSADPQLQAEKRRLAKEQADKLELANAAARREFLPVGEVESTWSGILRDVRAAFLALPTRLQQRLPHLTRDDVATIAAEVRTTLEEQAHAG